MLAGYSMARVSGIPAKFVVGFPLSKLSEGPVLGYHCWAEFYDEQIGWVPVDISEAWRAMPNHIVGPIFVVGFKILLVQGFIHVMN